MKSQRQVFTLFLSFSPSILTTAFRLPPHPNPLTPSPPFISLSSSFWLPSFLRSNYGISTTSAVEYWYVVEPDSEQAIKARSKLQNASNAWPSEETEKCDALRQRPAQKALPLAHFADKRKGIDKQLQQVDFVHQ